VLIVAFNASPTRLIQLYIVGVFVSFTCSQTGMIRHWNRLLRSTTGSAARLRMIRSRAVNTLGACVTGAVLVIVVISKFLDGAWIAVAAMVVLWLTMRGIQRHYQSVALELTPDEEASLTLPSSNIAIVLVSKLHLPTLRALSYARAARPARLEAVTVEVDAAETARLQQEWDQRSMPLPLTVISSPYREITRPVVEYVRRLRRESPRDIVTVYVPEYVLGHWWEQALHNQSALRLKARLLLERGVVVASVPYQLQSATHAAKTADPLMGGRLLADRESQHAAEVRKEVSALTGPDGRQCVPIAESQHRERVELAGTLEAVTTRPRGGSLTMEAELWDGTGRVTLVWLGRREIAGIQPGRRIVVHGRLTSQHGQRTIFNPSYELHAAGEVPGTGH
ncbi:MAG TPA: OB-fold nucleic acid binding domain-containing protein, partial [Streptosporangiaceae bacterium]|nr:OB-fold nucleic acid binding domain-containing protein [Streptosporangiaceae bacterium]